MTPKEIIQALEKEGITRYRISVDTNISQAFLSYIVNDKNKNLSKKTYKILINYYNQVLGC